MNILCYRYKQDSKFESILSILSKIKYNVGYASGDLNEKNLIDFKPDVILHNIPDVEKFPIKNNAINININETDNENSFSFVKTESKNYLEPFVEPKTSYVKDEEIPKFTSDILYIGSPVIFGNLLGLINTYDQKLIFKFFYHKPHNIFGYCGMCDSRDYFKFYKYAKASIVKKDDKNRLMDIIVSDGNPIVCDDNNDEEAFNKILSAIKNGEKYQVENLSRKDIIANHTSFDRAYKIFDTVGLKKLAEEINKIKQKWYKNENNDLS